MRSTLTAQVAFGIGEERLTTGRENIDPLMVHTHCLRLHHTWSQMTYWILSSLPTYRPNAARLFARWCLSNTSCAVDNWGRLIWFNIGSQFSWGSNCFRISHTALNKQPEQRSKKSGRHATGGVLWTSLEQIYLSCCFRFKTRGIWAAPHWLSTAQRDHNLGYVPYSKYGWMCENLIWGSKLLNAECKIRILASFNSQSGLR